MNKKQIIEVFNGLSTLNVRGLGKKSKRVCLLKELEKLNIQIIALQETRDSTLKMNTILWESDFLC